MLDFMVSHIGEILTLLLAIIAVVGLILSYIFRPTKIEVERRHTEDLKFIVNRWRESIPSPKTPLSEIKTDELYSLKISVEDEYLFSDIKNHLPSDLDVLGIWKKFKNSWYKYEKKRHDFFKNVKDDILKKTGLPFTTGWDKHPGFSTHLIKHIYDDLSSIIEGKKPYWVNKKGELKQLDGRHEFWCDNGLLWSNRKDVTEKAIESYLETLKSLPKSKYIEQARDLIKNNEQLNKQRETVIRKLNDFTSIPLLPGKCKYIKWSFPGIIEKVKKLFS